MVELNNKVRAESLTVHQITTFCRVYELGGYAEAAKSLDMAGPTIWEQVKNLEKIYRTKLFYRSGRNIVPTTSGHALYELLRPLLVTVMSTFERLAEEADEFAKQINLIVGVRMMLDELGKPLREFQTAFPEVRLRLMAADNATAQKKILDGDADMALLIEPTEDILASGIDYEILYPIQYLAVLPPRHRLIGRDDFSLEDLADDPMIVGNSQTTNRRMLEQVRFQLGIRSPIRIVAETDNSASTIACVRAGMGVGFIAGRPKAYLTKNLTTHGVAKVNVVAAYREGRQLTRVLQKMIELVRA
jgi:DNA-binding transcriptional LysR family regulator